MFTCYSSWLTVLRCGTEEAVTALATCFSVI